MIITTAKGRVLYEAQGELRGADLQKRDLSGAKLEGQILINTDFGHDNLDGSTQLEGTNFTDTHLSGANFKGATYNYKTLFPKGFDPLRRGMVRVTSA